MLLTIFNLPSSTRYSDVKSLIMAKCGPTEVILDNLVPHRENGSKKVTVGLAEEEDAAILVRKLNGLMVEGHQLIVETVKKKQAPNQNNLYKMTPSQLVQQSMHSGRPQPLMSLPSGPQQPALQQPYYQQTKYQSSYQLGFSNSSQNGTPSITPSPFAGVFGNSQNTNYGYPQQLYQQNQQQMNQSIGGFDQRAPLGFSNQGSTPSVWSKQNDWNPAGNASGGNQISQQSRGTTRWDSSDDRSSRHEPPRDYGRDRSRRSRGRDEPRDRRDEARRDYGRDVPSHDRGRDAPRDSRRDVSYRDRDRDANTRDRGRDYSRSAPTRDPPRNHPQGDRRSESSRVPKRHYSPPRSQQSGRVIRATARQEATPRQHSPWNKPQPNRTKAQSDYIPPPKRAKPGIGYVKQFDKQKADSQNKNDVGKVSVKPKVAQPSAVPLQPTKKYPKNAPERLELRSATWRNQLTSLFAKEIVSNPQYKTDIEEAQLLTGLKRAIRHRMEKLFAGDLEIRPDDMKKIYQEKFNDSEVFQEVVEHIKTHGHYVIDDADKAMPPPKRPAPTNNKPATPEMQKEKIEQPAQTTEAVKTLPSYPQGDKRLSKVHKKNTLEMFLNEESILSRLDNATRDAMDKEIDEMCSQICEELQDEPPPSLEKIHTAAKTVVVDDLKKILKVNFARRKLSTGPIMLRIFNNPKMISRAKLAPILAEYGVTSLRKTERKKPMYIGTCDNYEIHDKLCSMAPIQVECSMVTMKPFQLIGNVAKIAREKQKAQRNQNMQGISENEIKLEEGNEEDMNNEGDGEDGDNYGEEAQQNDDAQTSNTNEGIETTNADDDTYENGNIEGDEPQEGTHNEEIITDDKLQEDESQASCIESTERNEPTEIQQENTATLDIKPNYMDPLDSIGQITALPLAENEDFTADVDIDAVCENKGQDSFKIDAEGDLDADKDLAELNADDLEDFKTKINYDEIDMADLNEDDLEDW